MENFRLTQPSPGKQPESTANFQISLNNSCFARAGKNNCRLVLVRVDSSMVEQHPFKLLVPGSNPGRPTIPTGNPACILAGI